MTQRERQILQLIENNPMISQQEIGDKLGITRSSAAVHISNLIKKGHIAGKGYVLRNGSYVAVVGGINVDICGRSCGQIVPSDSNPGAVSVSLGGVGRNIAHNMKLLGLETRMLTAYGDDMNGERVAASCSELGIDISQALRVSGGTTSTYLYITHPDGEMALAVSDMDICNRITPEYLAEHLTLLNNAQVVAVDCNIPAESLAYLAENCTAPLFVDPVSTVKGSKLKPILHKIHTLKPNLLEAQMLSGIRVEQEGDVEKVADRLLELGVHRLLISMGSRGVYAAMGSQRLWLENLPGKMVNTTGCGDAFMAALVWAYLEGSDLKTTALAGLAAGAIAMESGDTINPEMSAENLQTRMNCKN